MWQGLLLSFQEASFAAHLSGWSSANYKSHCRLQARTATPSAWCVCCDPTCMLIRAEISWHRDWSRDHPTRCCLQARTATPTAWCVRPDQTAVAAAAADAWQLSRHFARTSGPLATALVRGRLFFPDRRLIQFDCGKLQVRGL